MKKNIFVLASILIAATLFLSSCAPAAAPAAEEPAAEQPAAEEPAAEPAAASEPVKIGVYSLAWQTPAINVMRELIEQFNLEYEGEIVAEYIQGNWDDVETYIVAGVAGGGGIADVIEFYPEGALDWYNQGYTIDLSPYITSNVRETIPDILWDARTTDDGAVYGSCLTSGEHMLIYYNTRLLEEVGITPPAFGKAWTMEQFLNNAKKLTVDSSGKRLGEEGFSPDDVVQWGFVPRLDQEKIWEDLNISTLQITEKPMIRRGEDGEWDIFFDEAAMPVIEAHMNLVTEGVTPIEAVGLGGSSQDELFYQGTAAMVQRSYFNIAVLESNYPDFEFGVMPIPMERDVYFQSAVVGASYSVPITSEHPEEAAKFVFWMQEPENQALWISAVMVPPCNSIAMENPIIQENTRFDVMRWYFDIQEYAEIEPNPNINEFQTTVFGPAMMDVIMGKITLEEGIELIKEVSKDVLNQ